MHQDDKKFATLSKKNYGMNMDMRREILGCLHNNRGHDEKIITGIEKLVRLYGNQTYCVIFKTITHLDLNPDEASREWQNIVDHRQEISKKIKRQISLQTAMCDYLSISNRLHNPIFMEIPFFEDQIRSARHDPLTALYNRAHLDDSLAREAAMAERYNTEFSLLFVDLDHFKRINDLHGHPTGDIILKTIAATIVREIRKQDLAARYGGEEIVIILPRTGKETGLIMSERIRKKIAASAFTVNQQNIPVTISIGLATFPIDASSPTKLIENADQAMYRAKKAGRNMVVPFSWNKRRARRINFNKEVIIKDLNIARKIKTTGKNLSQTGILLSCDKKISVGSRFEMIIPVPGEPLELPGSVVRSTQNNHEHEIGITFVGMKRKQQEQISAIIQEGN